MLRSNIFASKGWLAVWAMLAFVSCRTSAPAQTAASAAPPFRFGRGSLIQIVAPSTPLKLVEKAEISLILHDKGLTSLAVSQRRYLDPEHKIYDAYGIYGGDQTLPVHYRPDGSGYIEVIPLRLGEIELSLSGSFPDRAFDQNSIFVQVEPSQRKPEALVAASMGAPDSDRDILRLDLHDSPIVDSWVQDPKRRAYLFPAAYYLDFPVPIELDRSFVHFAVKQPEDAPVIDFDPATGGMRPLRVGAAMVETSFGGLTKRTCILVRVKWDIYHDSACETLFSAVRPTLTDPLDTTWTQNPYGMSNVDLLNGFEFPTDRLEVTPPNDPVEFGQPLEIPVKVTGGKLLYYAVAQMPPGHTNFNGQRITPKAGEGLPESISLIPLQFDDDLILITAHFADRGVSQRFFRLHVLPSGKGLKSVELQTSPTSDGYLKVWAMLHYEQFKSPVFLPDLTRTTWRIDRGQVADVLRVEPDGRIRRMRTGTAEIVATFCGVTGGVEVNVREPVQ